MPPLQILSPVAFGPAESHPLAPSLPTLRGRRLGIRIDHAWQSWWRAADEIGVLARAQLDVHDVVVFDPASRIGRPEDESRKVAEFAKGVDAAIVGLGT